MARVQDVRVDLNSVRRLSSPTLRRPGGFGMPALTKGLVGVLVVTAMIIAGVLTVVHLTLNKSTTSDISDTLSTTTTTDTTVTTTTATTSSTTTTTTTITTATTSTTSSTTTTTATTSTTSSTTTTTANTTTTASRRVFALTQVINGQTVTCSSVVNTNPAYTECDDLQKGGLYAPNGVTCTNAWSTTQSSYWATIAFCQAFLSSTNTYVQVFYDCNTSQTRFTWSSGGTWGTTTDNGYTKNLRCYY